MASCDDNGIDIAIHNLAPVIDRIGAGPGSEGTRSFKIGVAHNYDLIVANGGGAFLADQAASDYADPHGSIIPPPAAVGRNNPSQCVDVGGVKILRMLMQC